MSPSPEQRREEELPSGSISLRVPAKNDAENLFAELHLPELLRLLAERIDGLNSIYLFGSRRYRSGSVRSDIDLLVEGSDLPDPTVVAAIARSIDSYLDVFIQRGGQAQSAVNGSFIAAEDPEALRAQLDAVLVWQRGNGWLGEERDETIRILAGFMPPYSLRPPHSGEPLVASVEVLFVTALEREYSAMVSELDRTLTAPPGVRAQFQLGEIDASARTRTVAVCVADRPGPIPAAITTYRAIEMFRPSVVILIGITAGIKGEVCLGDIVVPDTVMEYEATKVAPANEEDRGRRIPLDPDLISTVKAWGKVSEVLEGISRLRPEPGASSISTATMASGSKVIADAGRAKLIAATSGKVAAVEMEALGVVEACRRSNPTIRALIVKAVSDYADRKKDDRWHAFTTHAAARVAGEFVRTGIV
jgi:nucleoside phosphorylase